MLSNQNHSKQPIIFIIGATAVGKSDVALKLAQKIHGEIISCDSMQIYKEINIASNKPDAADLKKVKHHLVGTISVTEEFDVAQFNKSVGACIQKIHNDGGIPIVVGGSGMYIQILLDGIFEGAPKNDELREQLRFQAKQYGNEYLYDKLKKIDHEAALKIHTNDLKRLIRALEVATIEKKPISQLKKNRAGLWGEYDIKIFVLNRNRAELYQKINERVDHMIARGLVDEIQALKDLPLSQTARYAIGIKEILSYLNGERELKTAVELMKQNTRRFAKQQLTWFRPDARFQWINIEGHTTLNGIGEKIKDQINYE